MRIPFIATKFSDFWIVILICLLAFFYIAPDLPHNELTHSIFDTLGSILVVICASGRFYSGLSYKKEIFNKTGLYSIVRHPRCVLAFIGMTGLGLITARFPLMVIIPIMAAFVFNYVINRQENQLILLYGNEYKNYQRNVPRLIPDFRLYKNCKITNISKTDIVKNFADVAFWLGLALCIEMMEKFGL